MGDIDENGKVCRHHSGHLARLNELQREFEMLRQGYQGLGEEIGSMKKLLFGFLMALLLGVYGNLLTSWVVSRDGGAQLSKKDARSIATEMMDMLESHE